MFTNCLRTDTHGDYSAHSEIPNRLTPDRAIKYMDRVKRIWYLSLMRAATVQARLRIRAVSPEPPLLAHTSSESRTFRQKARSLAPLNGWACAVKICHDGMLKDTNSLDGAHIIAVKVRLVRFKLFLVTCICTKNAVVYSNMFVGRLSRLFRPAVPTNIYVDTRINSVICLFAS